MRTIPATFSRALRGPALALIGAAALAACGSGGAAPPAATGQTALTSGPSTPAVSAAPSMVASTPAPTALQLMPIGMLPQADVPEDVDVSCEDATGAALSCEDAVALAARIGITTTGGAPIQQVLVERDAADANVVTITYWATDAETGEVAAFTTVMDIAAQTMSFPTENPEAVFPS
jgi:hypothetical protein